jgi:V-type H+-transporting ATPase subunit a
MWYIQLTQPTFTQIFSMFFYGRYIILLMAIFSLYTGALYNDTFSQSIAVFKPGFEWPSNFTTGQTVEAIPQNHTYIFGLDPVSGTIYAMLRSQLSR